MPWSDARVLDAPGNPLARWRPSGRKVAGVAHPTHNDAVAIVTGGSRGTGREIAGELASRGCAVVVVYLRDQGEAETTVDGILAAHAAALAVRADVTDELDVERLFDETKAVFGRVDLVVHAATRGASIVNQEAARQLRRGGAIVAASGCDAAHDVADLVALLDQCRASPGGTAT